MSTGMLSTAVRKTRTPLPPGLAGYVEGRSDTEAERRRVQATERQERLSRLTAAFEKAVDEVLSSFGPAGEDLRAARFWTDDNDDIRIGMRRAYATFRAPWLGSELRLAIRVFPDDTCLADEWVVRHTCELEDHPYPLESLAAAVRAAREG